MTTQSEKKLTWNGAKRLLPNLSLDRFNRLPFAQKDKIAKALTALRKADDNAQALVLRVVKEVGNV